MLAHERSDLDAIDSDLLIRMAFQMFNLIKGTMKPMKLKDQFMILGDGGGAERRNNICNQFSRSDEVAN